MPIAAHLLGPPLMVRDGVVYAPPKGKKVWALFGYLVLSERQPTRSQLIELLFPDAEDPAGALRWNLSELRRLLGGPDTVGSGNVVQLRLPEGSVIDVDVLMAGTSLEAVELPGLGRELLEGVDVDASAGFTAWLLGQRRRLQALGEAVLREGALRALASGNARTAVELATRMVAADALNEDAHVLLIRAFAGTGDRIAVERQLAASIDLFRRELDVEPGPELAEAAVIEPGRTTPSIGAGRPALQALIESGEAADERGGDRGRPGEPARRRGRQPRGGRDRDRGGGAARARVGARARDARQGRGGRRRAPPMHRGGRDHGAARARRVGAPRARLRRGPARRVPARVAPAADRRGARRRRRARAREHPRGDAAPGSPTSARTRRPTPRSARRSSSRRRSAT